MHKLLCQLIILLSMTSADAGDEYSIESAPTEDLSNAGSSHRSKANKWLFPPGGVMSLGTHLRFITANGDGMVAPIRFTDIGLAELYFRISVKGAAEIGTASSFLIKQDGDSNIWQNGSITFKVGLTNWLGAYLNSTAGTLIQDDGIWLGGSSGLFARANVNRNLAFEATLGAAGLRLIQESVQDSTAIDASASVKTIFRNGRYFAAWLGFGYRVNTLSTGTIDLNTALNVELGAVWPVTKTFDIYSTYTFSDRGSFDQPQTQLPILIGGFDQQQFMFGVATRFGGSDKKRRD